MDIILLISVIIAILLCLILLIYIALLLLDSILVKIPFVSTKDRALNDIALALDVDNNSVCYELGCGEASVLRQLRRKSKVAKLIGVERGVLPFLVAKILTKNKNIEIRFEDMFKTDISDATHIYLYTGTNAMKIFEKKIYEECKSGTKIVTMDFKFPNKEVFSHKNLKEGKYKLSQDLYVYRV